jgi:hypothetical protein
MKNSEIHKGLNRLDKIQLDTFQEIAIVQHILGEDLIENLQNDFHILHKSYGEVTNYLISDNNDLSKISNVEQNYSKIVESIQKIHLSVLSKIYGDIYK